MWLINDNHERVAVNKLLELGAVIGIVSTQDGTIAINIDAQKEDGALIFRDPGAPDGQRKFSLEEVIVLILVQPPKSFKEIQTEPNHLKRIVQAAIVASFFRINK